MSNVKKKSAEGRALLLHVLYRQVALLLIGVAVVVIAMIYRAFNPPDEASVEPPSPPEAEAPLDGQQQPPETAPQGRT